MGKSPSAFIATTPARRDSASQSTGPEAGVSPRKAIAALSEPSVPSRCLTPTAPTKGGRIIGASRAGASRRRSGKAWRWLRTASGRATQVAAAVVAAPMRRELSRPSR